jgi:tetratricopeptide (TPR) repeat protein
MKKFSFMLVVAIFSFLLFAQISVSAQTNSINGMIFSKNSRTPVGELWVELINDFNVTVSRIKTSSSGRYIFTGMRSGRYTIRIRTAGTEFEEETRDVEIVNTPIGGRLTSDSLYEDFYLKLSKSATANQVNQVLFAQDIPKGADEHYKSALKSIEDKKNDEAISYLRNAVGIFPTYFLALQLLGDELSKQSKFDEAYEFYTRSIAVNPKSYQGWYGLAFSASSLGKTAESITAAKKAVEIAPNSAGGSIILGIALRTDKQFKAAETAFLKAKTISGNKNPNVNWNLALLYYHNLKLYKEAANELESYLKLSPELPKPEVENLRKLITKCRELQKQS